MFIASSHTVLLGVRGPVTGLARSGLPPRFVNEASSERLLRQFAATKATTAGVPGAAAALGWSCRRTPN